MNVEDLKKQLIIDEGIRYKPYKDTVGKLTIGIGRNLDDVGLSHDEVILLLMNDIEKVETDLDKHIPWWRKLNEARQQVLANMCFNLGVTKLLGFKNTLKAMEEGRYNDAANGMQDSLWAKQVGPRATRLTTKMRTGV